MPWDCASPTVDCVHIDLLAAALPTTADDGASLRSLLTSALRASSGANPALDALIRDYTVFHAVLALIGGVFLLAVVALSVASWTRFARARRQASATAFERRTYAGFAALTLAVGLFLALVVAANVSTVVSPRNGFADSLGLLGNPHAGSRTAQLQDSVAAWVRSGRAEVPSLVEERVGDRLAWQRPKAVVCTVLLVVFVVLSAGMWRNLVRRARAPGGGVGRARAGLLVGGSLSVAASLLLMLMVMGNAQGSVAPLSLTLFLG
jgi:hypothetical protein